MRLSTRLSIIVFSVGLTITVLNLFAVRQEMMQQETRSQKIFAETLVRTMADAVASDVINGDKVQLTRMLQVAQSYKNNPIEYLYVTDMKGDLFAHSYDTGFPEFLNKHIAKHSSSNSLEPISLVAKHNIENRGLIYEYAVALIPGLSAQLYTGLNQTEIQAVVNAAGKKMLTFGMLLSLLCTWLAWLATRYVVRPIEQISSTLRGYQPGANIDFLCRQSDALDIQALKRTLQEVFNSRDYYENLLKEREQDLKVTLSSIGDAVIATDEQGLVTRMNPVAQALTGWAIEDARGLPVKAIFPIINASTREPIANPVEKVLETGETVYLSNHTTLISKGGAEYQIADSAAPIRDANDTILGMVLVFNDITEQYELRQAAYQAQQQMQKTFDDMQTMVAVLDTDFKFVLINNTPLKISGLESGDVIGEKLWMTDWFNYDPALQKVLEADFLEALSGQTIRRDIQIMTDKGLIWVAFGLHPIFDEHGKVIQLVAEAVDVSERKYLEAEMRASMQHLQLYREQTPLASIEWNTDLQVVNWNKAAEAMFGYSLNEVKGRDFVDIMLPESAVIPVEKVWQGLMANTGGMKSTNENTTKAGRTILCEWYNNPLIDESGKVIGAVSLVRDITGEHTSQQALLKSEQEQREILDTLSDGVITISDKGVIQTFNRAAEYLFGLSSAEAIGQNVSVLMPEPDKAQHDSYLEGYIQSGRKRPLEGSREVVGLHQNKTTFPIRLTVAELPLSAEGKQRFIGSCQDLTEIKSQQAQIQRAQKMSALGKLVGGIAHDYNNMLGVILGYTSLMEMKFPDVEGLQKYIGNISQAGERARQLTKRMLAFSKHESTQAEAIDVNSLLKEQKDLFSKSLTAMVKINYQLFDSLGLIWVDKSELEDTLLNLVINAKQAMPDGGRLTLRTLAVHLSNIEADNIGLAENDYITLSVTDSGYGIDKEIMDSIFDPFFTTKGVDGTGLGLSQVYGFTERSGGTIKVYSQKDVGTEFTLYFPLYQGKEKNDAETAEVKPYRQGEGQTILVVDDEPALRRLAQEILTMAGYHVLTTKNGSEAIEMLATTKFDVVLSDVIMPEVDGYQLANHIEENYPHIKIQLATGFSSNRHSAMKDKRLKNNILYKPYRTDELLSRISALIYGEQHD
mgnify:CR=1 FL=1